MPVLNYKYSSFIDVTEKLGQHGKAQALAYNILGITPHDIHEKHKKTYGKRRHKQQQKAFKDKEIKSFRSHSECKNFQPAKLQQMENFCKNGFMF